MFSFIKSVALRLHYTRQPQNVALGRPQIVSNVVTKCWGNRYLQTEENDATEKIVDDLCKGDEESERRLRVLMLEVEVMRQDGRRAPQDLDTRHWKHLLELPSKSQRHNYLMYLFKREMAKLNDKAKKAERKLHMIEPPTKEFPDDLLYGLCHQTLFIRISDRSINNFDNYRALQAMQFGQSLVLDCSYEDKMVSRELLNAAKQVTLLFGDNRVHSQPFNLHMCNVQRSGRFMEQLERNIPTWDEPWFPLNVHQESYLDKFPKEQLVYLTPHCREELTRFDHNAVYIIGCIVDKVNNEPLSLAKAKREGIKMAKLPLDRYLEWGMGSKTLNINHMVSILLELKRTGDWASALRHVPRRKLMETRINEMRDNLRGKTLRDITNMRRASYTQKQKQRKPFAYHSLFDDDSK